jgi:hypothetical protein
VQKAGPYLLIELLLPGGTLIALLVFLLERRGVPIGALMQPLADLVPPLSIVASMSRGLRRERDGLEALAMAPARDGN